MAEALLQVRREYGSDGVILHTRSFKQGGFLGLGSRTVVEVTAASGREIGRKQRQSARRAAAAARSTPRPASSPPREQAMAGDLIRKTYQAAQAELRQKAPAPEPPEPASPSGDLPSPEIATRPPVPPSPTISSSTTPR